MDRPLVGLLLVGYVLLVRQEGVVGGEALGICICSGLRGGSAALAAFCAGRRVPLLPLHFAQPALDLDLLHTGQGAGRSGQTHTTVHAVEHRNIGRPVAAPVGLGLLQGTAGVLDLPVCAEGVVGRHVVELLALGLNGGVQGLHLGLQLLHLGLGLGVLLALRLDGLELLDHPIQLAQLGLGGGQIPLGVGDVRLCDQIGVPGSQGLLQVLPQVLHAQILRGVVLGVAEDLLLVLDLLLAQGLLGLLEFLALHIPQHEQQIPLLHLVSHLHAYAPDLPGLVQGHLVALIGGHRAAAADLGVDGAGCDQLRGHLGQGAVHDRL